MGGFSDNYECGYWGDETPPMQKSKDKKFNLNRKIYKEKVSTDYRFLIVLLTSVDLLSTDEQKSRANLCQTWDEDIVLEIRHNEKNKEDNKTLEIYYEGVFIGAIQKIFEEDEIDNTPVVNEYCFINNKLKDIQAFWDDENFYLRQKS